MTTGQRIDLSERLGPTWMAALGEEFEKEYFIELQKRIAEEMKAGFKIWPNKEDIFNAFKRTSVPHVKVVIIGQDPYPHHHAHGLSFSSLAKETPASLRNIFKELKEDMQQDYTLVDNDLSVWANQGVLLLNSCLTVSEGKANSHQGFGWENFTAAALKKVYEYPSSKVWILWGNNAQQLFSKISKPEMEGYLKKEVPDHEQLVLVSAHPSPLSAHKGFFGSRPFSKTNVFLEKVGLEPIEWNLPF